MWRNPCSYPSAALDGRGGVWADERDEARDDERDEPEGEARGERLRAAMATALTDKQREVVELHFFEGLSQGEIARRLGVTQQVVQKRLHGTARRGKMIGGALPKLRAALGQPAPRAPGRGP